MRPLYISATVQDSGKSSVICGLMQALQQCEYNPAYFKPVGQRYIRYRDDNVDEDAVLMLEAFDLPDEPHYMSPIAIERGFTSKFIFNPDAGPMEREILSCRDKLLTRHSMILVEGTGHAGVGSCFALSNARVAELLGAKVVIVTTGGVGRPIDEIALSLALFRQQQVEVIGVILNKVLPEKLEKIKTTVGRGLKNLGTHLLGALPYEPLLSSYTVKQIAAEFGYSVLCGANALGNRVGHTLVAAMEPQDMIRYIQNNTLIITPGDRIDNILISIILSTRDQYYEQMPSACGLILTGGFKPHSTILPLLHRSSIPVLISQDDTFTVSSRMKDLQFKIQPNDHDKITSLHTMINEHIDVKTILDALNE